MEQTIIQIKNVHATYGHGARAVHALRDVNLSVRTGEIFGLLGPNGAGKTTLLACLEGLYRPERGLVMVNGLDVTREPDRVKRQLGIQLQRTALMDDLTAGELMQAYAAMYEIFPGKAEIRARLAQFGLAEQVRVFPRRMSGGQQQRLALALALVNDPAVVLLDEPTGVLDPRSRRSVWELIRRMHAEGRTVILTTHSMEEAEALCERVAIMNHGQIIACDTPAQLITNLNGQPVESRIKDRAANLEDVFLSLTGQALIAEEI